MRPIRVQFRELWRLRSGRWQGALPSNWKLFTLNLSALTGALYVIMLLQGGAIPLNLSALTIALYIITGCKVPCYPIENFLPSTRQLWQSVADRSILLYQSATLTGCTALTSDKTLLGAHSCFGLVTLWLEQNSMRQLWCDGVYPCP